MCRAINARELERVVLNINIDSVIMLSIQAWQYVYSDITHW